LKISLKNTGKRYSFQWIFRHLHLEFNGGEQHAILGNNGSGKSTLLQLISGYVSPSEGNVEWITKAGNTERDHIYKFVSLCTPAMQLQSEWTVIENIEFHLRFKKTIKNKKEILDIALLTDHSHKKYRNLSSGMQQRLKLSLTCITNDEILLLDEPCSHLDAHGVSWYKRLIEQYAGDKIVIIASNSNPDEIFRCTQTFTIESAQTSVGGAS
jgi:ABC-type multidrug transport system ATPase subunit